MMHTWIILAIEEIEIVYSWRLEAERKMKAAGKEGMNDDAVKAFVSRFMPAYEQYRSPLYQHGPTISSPILQTSNSLNHHNLLKVSIDPFFFSHNVSLLVY
jgi:pantothenate kinase-related protein Tda10